jgi:hypothetical protein
LAPTTSSPTTTGPVGDGDYVVRQGECLASIAFAHRMQWQSIWDHPRNAVPKQSRGEPNILLPGDRLYIPELELQMVDASTDTLHRFSLKTFQSKIRVRVVEWVFAGETYPITTSETDAQGGTSDDQAECRPTLHPRANLPYQLCIDDQSFSGHTDSEGWIENHLVPPNARKGRLILEPGTVRAYETLLQMGVPGPEKTAASASVSPILVSLPEPITNRTPRSFSLLYRRFRWQAASSKRGDWMKTHGRS